MGSVFNRNKNVMARDDLEGYKHRSIVTLTPPPLRFTSSKSGVLVASDVAARGLDLPAVEHIVHYQVPRNSEVSIAIIS